MAPHDVDARAVQRELLRQRASLRPELRRILEPQDRPGTREA